MRRNQNPATKQKGEESKHDPKHHPHIQWEQVPELLEAINLNRCSGQGHSRDWSGSGSAGRTPPGDSWNHSWSEANQEDRRPPASRTTDQGDECPPEAGKADEWSSPLRVWSCKGTQQISTPGPRITQQPPQGFGIQRSAACSWLEVITSDRRTRSSQGTSRHHPETYGTPDWRQGQKGI